MWFHENSCDFPHQSYEFMTEIHDAVLFVGTTMRRWECWTRIWLKFHSTFQTCSNWCHTYITITEHCVPTGPSVTLDTTVKKCTVCCRPWVPLRLGRPVCCALQLVGRFILHNLSFKLTLYFIAMAFKLSPFLCCVFNCLHYIHSEFVMVIDAMVYSHVVTTALSFDI